MNRTQTITCNWLLQSGLVRDELLLEALLRRGFLAYRDEQGVWLGTGSHPEDIDVLQFVRGLEVEPLSGHQDRMARVAFHSMIEPEMNVALRIIAIPENRSFNGGADGPFNRWGRAWGAYSQMVWGVKIAVCPTTYRHKHRLGYYALDLGVALLIKALPLARIATHVFSCDGHGDRPAGIAFRFNWDGIWGNAVFDALAGAMKHSNWTWRPGGLNIVPIGGFGDAEILGMLNDIQSFSRQLLNQTTIKKIGRSRANTLRTFCNYKIGPSDEDFAAEAARQLTIEFSLPSFQA